MAETFYTTLDVDAEADVESIRRAYREQVKRYHPDVSDDPGAPREFNRLTTARDVLVDESERDRYDRLGHATYVSRHLESSAWGGATQSGTDDEPSTGSTATQKSSSSSETQGETTNESGASTRRRHRAAGHEDYDRSAWLGDDWERAERRRGRHHASAPSGAATSTAGGTDAPWQQASEAYRYQPSAARSEDRRSSSTVRRVARSIGPWIVVHLIFVSAAVGTAWYVSVSSALGGNTVLPALAFGILLVGLTLLLSALHLVSLVFS